MPHGYMERQYQLQAQRRHEESLKHDFYKKTSQYFEQESIRANQFNSWNSRSIQKINELHDQVLKKERLCARQEKLKELLKQEEAAYKLEIDKINSSKTKREPTPSLEALRKKLREKRAEQNLYYPSSCRRPNFYYPSRSTDNIPASINGYNLNAVDSNSKSEDHSPVNGKNPSKRRPALSESCLSNHFASHESLAPSVKQNLKYAVRYSRRSLENTNIRDDYDENKCEEKPASCKATNGIEKKIVKRSSHEVNIQRRKSVVSTADTEITSIGSANDLNHSKNEEHGTSKRSTKDELNDQRDKDSDSMYVNVASDHNKENSEPEFRRKKSILSDFDMTDSVIAANPKLSLKMFRLLKNNDLKRKILDLCQREHMACRRQSWDEALRLREMRGRLVLLKNKNLYENDDLNIEDHIKKCGLNNIAAQEKLLKKRHELCDVILYSDEAKHIWKQWVQEDDKIEKSDQNISRENFLKELEEEWKRLAFKDKKRMSQLFDRVMTKSALQDEHQLTAIIKAANMNSYNAQCIEL